jgi:hypothetical protein
LLSFAHAGGCIQDAEVHVEAAALQLHKLKVTQALNSIPHLGDAIAGRANTACSGHEQLFIPVRHNEVFL